MIYRKLIITFITVAILITITGCQEKQEGFLLIFWKNAPGDRLEEMEGLSYGKMLKHYEPLETVEGRHVINYYWDEQVLEIDEKLLFEDNGRGLAGHDSGFFSIVLDGEVLLNGLNRTIISSTDSVYDDMKIATVQLDVDYNSNRLYLVLKPGYKKSFMTYKDFSEEERKRVALPELYDYFSGEEKIVKGAFELPGPFWKIGDGAK